MSTGAYDMSMSTTNDYVHVVQPQVGGGHRAPSSPVIVTPTQTLHPRIKAMSKDAGLVRDAAVRRRQLPTPAPLPHSGGEVNLDDNPFLSEPVVQPSGGARQPLPLFPLSGSTNNNNHQQSKCYFSCLTKLTVSWNIGYLIHNATPADNTSPNDNSDNTPQKNENVPGAPTQEPAVECRGSHSRASSTNPSWPPLCQGTQPGGLAPVANEESRGECQGYCSREPSTYPSPPPFRLATKLGPAQETSTYPSPPPFHLATNPGLAPSIASVDKLDVEPASRIYPSLPSSPLFSGHTPSTSLDKPGFEPASHMANMV